MSKRPNGVRSREKGGEFERKIATILRTKFPQYAESIRRSDQGFGARTSDITGFPYLWIECQDAKEPTPGKKLEQAIRDSDAYDRSGSVPIAITHRTGTRSIEVTLRLADLVRIVLMMPPSYPEEDVTLELYAFLRVVKESPLWR